MKLKKLFLLLFFLGFIVSYEYILGTSHSYCYKYTQQDEVVGFLKKGWPIIILDIQNENQYKKHHIKKSMPTFAYPVKSRSDERQLWQVSSRLKNRNSHIVIVGPFGDNSAKRAYDYLKNIGIDKKRLFILQGGMQNWSYYKYVN